MLRSHENNYLAAFVRPTRKLTREPGLAHVDISTGEFRATEIDSARGGSSALEALNAREVLAPSGTQQKLPCLKTDVEAWVFEADYASRSLRDHFHLLALDGCGLDHRPLATGAASAILHYLRDTQRATLDHLERPSFYDRADALVLDATTIRNLELVEPLFAGESREATLLSVLDRTRTGMGGRLLRRRLLAPSLDIAEIDARLDAVAELHGGAILRGSLAKDLASILDLERLLSKISLASAGPRDLLALARSLAVVPLLKQRIAEARAGRFIDLSGRLDDVADVRDRVLGAIAEEPPVNISDGGTIRSGFDQRLDELRDLSQNSKTFLARIEQRERDRTGIGSLKIRFNNVFGYYIEISKANMHLAPVEYERKQTLVSAERFTTPELKELEGKILEAEERMLAIEREIFEVLRALASSQAGRIRATAAAIAELDVTVALAEIAAERRYVRPRFSDGEMKVVAARHPVIEKLAEQDAQRFIPNDLYFHPETEFISVITGPNMGGKSTYLRQAALLSILAQMGSYVPADSALVPIVDRVFTRIGHRRTILRAGGPTFMVEMTETAVILNTATSRSLIVLDEIGRGTSTYDGLALAWAVIEHIQRHIRAKTLFATHYHELTELADPA